MEKSIEESDVTNDLMKIISKPALEQHENTTFRGNMCNIYGEIEDLPKSDIVLDRLGIEKGNLTIVCGTGSSGKSFLLQSMAVSCIMERPFLGEFAFNQFGNVVHIDGEQSDKLTTKRYRRLIKGIQELEFGTKIVHKIWREVPKNKFDQGKDNQKDSLAQSKMDLLEICKGSTLVIIDSLKNLSGCDENSSEIEKIVSMLKQVAEEANTAVLLIHHKGKVAGSAKQTGRGHSSIYDACDVQIDIECINKEKYIYEINCAKNRDGEYFKSIQYTVNDFGDWINDQRCKKYISFQTITEADYVFEDKQLGLRFKTLDVLNNINEGMPKSKLFEIVKGSKPITTALFDKMVVEGILSETPKGMAKIMQITNKGLSEYETIKNGLKQ